MIYTLVGIPLIAQKQSYLKGLISNPCRGNKLVNKRVFSMYDIEQFLRDAGAERINEKAVISLERELQNTVNEIVDEAAVYANYAGRKKLINVSDIELANKGKSINYIKYKGRSLKRNRKGAKPFKSKFSAPKLMIINNKAVIKEAQLP
jgi:histone H3/H4